MTATKATSDVLDLPTSLAKELRDDMAMAGDWGLLGTHHTKRPGDFRQSLDQHFAQSSIKSKASPQGSVRLSFIERARS